MTEPNPIDPKTAGDLGSKSPLFDRLEELGKPWEETIDPKTADDLGSKGYIKCSAISSRWIGGIERKTINNRQYYYWRHQVAGAFGKRRKASDYLGSSWEKAIKRLRRKQEDRLNI